MIEMIGEFAGKKPKIKFLPVAQGDMLHTSASIEKAEELLGWTPNTPLTNGIQKLVLWHHEQLTK
jgi:nucleoside-diphosphate-sugar epimerase